MVVLGFDAIQSVVLFPVFCFDCSDFGLHLIAERFVFLTQSCQVVSHLFNLRCQPCVQLLDIGVQLQNQRPVLVNDVNSVIQAMKNLVQFLVIAESIIIHSR